MLGVKVLDRVAKIETEGDSCKVTREVCAKVNEEVTFENLTESSVTILFPDEGLFKIERLPLGPGEGKSQPVLAPEPTDRPHVYPYAVYCDSIKDFAHASSMPIIIVYP